MSPPVCIYTMCPRVLLAGSSVFFPASFCVVSLHLHFRFQFCVVLVFSSLGFTSCWPPSPVPRCPWSHIALDFITGLPPSSDLHYEDGCNQRVLELAGPIHSSNTCCSDQTSFYIKEVKLTQSLTLRGEMAQKSVQLDRETFSCSICLDLLKNPVTLPCGHSYCMKCIESFWDEEEKKKIYSCPQCRQTFTARPVLVKSTMLAVLVEQLKKTGLQAAPADHCYAGPEDVACDFCTGRKMKAFKSCLFCLASYCEKHLQPHYDVAPLKKHKLVEPSKKLQENICSRHDEVMKMFCRTDQQSICYLCSVDEHKGHDTVSAAAERTERQRELEVSRQNIQQRIQDREKDVKLLQQEVEAINQSADQTVEHSEKIFTELIHLIQKRSSDVKQQIRSQQETEVSRVKELQEKLEQEITELKRKDAELKQLSHTEDHIQFLHNYPSLSALSESTDSSSINIRPLSYFEDVTAAVSEVRDKLQDILREEWTNISLTVTEVDVSLSDPQPEPKTRAGFLKYSCEITLDPNTAYKKLLLSEGNRKATFMNQQQSYSDHPDRFTEVYQVLSRESLTGRCYWEVEWRGIGVYVAVAYKNISREGGNECRFGHNDKSWSLYCNNNRYIFWYNNIETRVSGPRSSRVGVYLDHRAGILSFYSISETMTLLHRVQTTFTQPLYAGLSLYCYGATAELIKVK
uniref:tripartite motif-containing protein 16-like isoform X1 n=2 Tax=Maylandia zebra TaxID=106582 RepID=UPI000D2F9862|nr:tripartite motif-containing protein 16-like isoform X1 [Maylandia zebra]